MMDLSLVPPGMVCSILPQILPYLKVSEEWTSGRATADDILAFILSRQMQLWVVMDDQNIYGHLITEVKQYHQCKMFAIQYCAMEPHVMEQVSDRMQELAEGYAKAAGCVGIEFTGRPGWSKVTKKYGYEIQSVSFQRFFK